MTVKLYATHFKNLASLRQEKHKTKNSFFYDLLYGNLRNNEEIARMAKIWGWDLSLEHQVLVFTINDLENASSDWHLMDIVSSSVNKLLIEKYFKNPMTTTSHNEFIVFNPVLGENKEEQKETLLSLVENIFALWKEGELAERVICGIGQPYGESNALFRSYQEAKVACKLGDLLKVKIPFFSDMGLERILYKHDLQDLKEYYQHVLGPLLEQTEDEEGLLETLEHFTNNQFDVTKTSQELFVHRNTLRYRLNKIESILGRTIDDMNTRLDLTAAFKILHLHGKSLED